MYPYGDEDAYGVSTGMESRWGPMQKRPYLHAGWHVPHSIPMGWGAP